MTTKKSTSPERKGLQVSLEVHAALEARRLNKVKYLFLAGHLRKVTLSEIIADLLPELNKK